MRLWGLLLCRSQCCFVSRDQQGLNEVILLAAGNPQAESTLDFSALLAVLIIEPRAALVFRSIALRNYASQRVGRDSARLLRRNITYEVQGIGAWPSIIACPGSEVRSALCLLCAAAAPARGNLERGTGQCTWSWR